MSTTEEVFQQAQLAEATYSKIQEHNNFNLIY